MTDAETWIKDHIYVPIIVGLVVVAVFMGVLCCLCRKRRFRGSYYVYKRLEHEAELVQQMESEREAQQNVVRDTAYMNCQYYLRSHPNYRGMQQLKDLGSRIDKFWFLATDIRTEEENILSCLQFNDRMTVPFTKSSSKTLKDLFSLLKHPHIFPVTDFDFSVEQNLIFVFQPVSQKGSLKDLIYQCRYAEPWYSKYSQRSKGLPVDSIRTFGKQILNGMLYLEEKGFPAHGNIHSGNIMLVDNVCKVSAYENCFLGNTSRVYTLVKKKLKGDNKNALDSISFGHLIYEMAFGFELASSSPEPQHLIGHQSPAIVEILNFIFENERGIYPTVREIAEHPFFRDVVMSELMRYNPAKIHLSEPMKTLLKTVKKGKPQKPAKSASSKKRRPSSQAAPPTSPTATSTLSLPPKLYTNSNIQLSAPSSPTSPAPPPPPPPPPPPAEVPREASSSGRQALLGDIRKGSKLKKTLTNDRSSPKV